MGLIYLAMLVGLLLLDQNLARLMASPKMRLTSLPKGFYIRYWNSLPALVKASESVTTLGFRLDIFMAQDTSQRKVLDYPPVSYGLRVPSNRLSSKLVGMAHSAAPKDLALRHSDQRLAPISA